MVRIEPDTASIKAAIDKLGNVSAGLTNAIILRIYKKHAKKMIKAAKDRVPVDTGGLKDSIGFKEGKKTRKSQRINLFVGPILKIHPAWHQALVEYGTSRMRPRPYMRPAADSTLGAITTGIEADLKKEVEKLAQRK